MNRKIMTVALVAAMVLTLTGLVWADQGAAKPNGQRVGYLQQGVFQQLTPDQREELRDRVKALREEGATSQEIREAVAKMLKEWGVKPRVGQSGPQAGPRWGQQAAPPRWGQQAGPPRWGQQAAPPLSLIHI